MTIVVGHACMHHYRFERRMSKDRKGVSRRELLTFWRRPLVDAVERARPPAPLPPPLRPPGTASEALLVDSCIRCGKCVDVCPARAIAPLGGEWGADAGTPAIDARRQPCVLCTGLQCTHVCPSGALVPIERNGDVRMGTAIVDEARCLVWRGQACDACVRMCPMPGALALADGALRVIADKCVGCGLCEHVCPTEPASIRVKPRA
jgi:MauM/NapG family ferredoxin protein